MMQQSRQKLKKRALKNLWKYYDDDASYWKADQLRGMTKQLAEKEIQEQLKDSEDEYQR